MLDQPFDYLLRDPEFIGPDITYDGPKCGFASVTESPFWPLSDVRLRSALADRGWIEGETLRVPTPFGLGPVMTVWSTPEGLGVLWIRDYGRTGQGEHRARQLSERLFWVLWKAGIHTVLAGVHSGIADWRKPEDRVLPGDLVIPWTFEGKSWFNGLPGTPYESAMNNAQVIETREIPWPYFDEPQALAAGRHFLDLARSLVADGTLRRSWSPEQVRAVACDKDHIGFQTHYDIYLKLATSRLISEMQPDRPPVVTLHGVVLNPVLCRLLQIEMLQYHVISNPAAGITPDISALHDRNVYDSDQAMTWLAMEAKFFETYASLTTP